MFNSLFLEVLNDHAPIKRVKIKSRPNPYITPEIRQLMRTRDKWHKSAIKTKDRLHWNAYRFFRQEVKREIRLAEMEHVRTELQNSNGNSNSIWKVLNRCLPRKDPPFLTTEDPFSQANKFNKFYTSVGISAALKAKTLAEKHGYFLDDESTLCPLNSCLHDNQCPLFKFQSVTEEEVGKIIRSLPSNKTPGLDKVTARVLKDSLPITLSAITNLVNTSFSSNTFAQVWKSAEVIPILKSGDPDEPSNTRPISLLPIMSKVCERSAHSQFVDFLDQNEKISKLQSGNRRFHSTETALLYFADEILKNMDDKKVSVIVLLDMSKAFDSIRHDLMLSKLHRIGVSSGACTWFGSYLSQRCQVVNIANSVSDPLPLTVGVPQGSILGPVLFTLYVNDLLSVPRHCQAMGYIDDTKIFLGLPSSQISDAVTALNKDLSEIARWCCTNSLLINPDKTKLLVIRVPQLTRSLPSIPPVKLLGKEIKSVTVAKDLGVIFDSSLSFNEHVTKTVSDCMHRLIRINRIKHLLDRKTLLSLINAFVFSKLFYCSSVWSNTSKTNIKRLQLVQNFAGRIVLGLRKYDRISDGLESLKWLPIADKLFLNDSVMVHKCLNGRAPDYLSQKFTRRLDLHNRDTRNKKDLNLPRCRLKTGQRSFAYRGAACWNSLPKDLKEVVDGRIFKKRFVNMLLT